MFSGPLLKMGVSLRDAQASYTLRTPQMELPLSPYIGQPLHIRFKHQKHCMTCGRSVTKLFGEGFCFPCFRDSPENAECIVRPELCRAHLGEGRDPQWEKDHHLQPHCVYLALSSGVKVGVTRTTQIPTRWIDQGAIQALLLAETPNRYLAGCIEVALKAHVSDKTAWQRMLKNEIQQENLIQRKQTLIPVLSNDLRRYITTNDDITHILYPVQAYPEKVSSINLDKMPEVSGILMGIKGQYLILDQNRVLNIRSHTGYDVEVII